MACLYCGGTARTATVREQAFGFAESLAGEGGIVNLGSGSRKAGPYYSSFAAAVAHSPLVRENIDIAPDGVPNFRRLDLEEPLPFGDEEFDVAFASHILEHLNDPWRALDEWRRIARRVVIVIPHPLSPHAYIDPDHKHYFDFGDIRDLNSFDDVFVFC